MLGDSYRSPITTAIRAPPSSAGRLVARGVSAISQGRSTRGNSAGDRQRQDADGPAFDMPDRMAKMVKSDSEADDLDFHCLRHHFCTMLCSAERDPKKAKNCAGTRRSISP